MSAERDVQHWCVVGAGLMGLTLAKKLAEAGQDVTLLESAPEIGGLASAWTLGDVVWDRHYHVTLLSDLLTRQMLTELGLERDMRWVETKTGFFSEGRLYSMSNSWEFLKFPPLSLWQKFRLGLTIFAASKIRHWRRLENITATDWLTSWSGAGTFRKIWQPLLRAKLGTSYQKVSAAFIWATITRMYRARQTGLKKEMFGYLPGGYARVFAAYAEKLAALQVKTFCSTHVKQVTSSSHGSVRVSMANGETADFDKVVLTVPAKAIANLCPDLQQSERQRHSDVEYLGILCASVLLTKPLAQYYVTNIIDDGIPFTAVIEMTALVDPKEFGARHLVYLPRYATSDDPAWRWTDEELRNRFVEILLKMYPHLSKNDVLEFRVSRVGQVMALPTLNYSTKRPPIKTSVPNVFAVNSAQIVKGTLNVNEVIEIAEDAFHDVLAPELTSSTQPISMPNHV